MADTVLIGGVYPTVARVGGDNYAIHMEPNVSKALAAVAGGSRVASGFEVVSTTSVAVTLSPGKAIISGYYVETTADTKVYFYPGETNYIYLKLIRDGYGLVTDALIECNTTGVKPTDSIPLYRVNFVNTFAVPTSLIPTSVDIKKEGDIVLIDGEAVREGLYTPSNDELYVSTGDRISVSSVDEFALLWSIRVPYAGHYRFISVLGLEHNSITVKVTSNTSSDTTEASAGDMATSISVDTPYVAPGEKLTMYAKVDTLTKAIFPPTVCGKLHVPQFELIV
jgi:hypothetical protein